MGEEAGVGYDFHFLGGDEYEGMVSEWKAGLPGCDELTPLLQPLVPPGLTAAFRVPPEPVRTLLDVRRASSATVSRLRSNSSSPSGTGGGSASKGGDQDTNDNTNNSAESADEKSRSKRPRLVWTPQLHKLFVDMVAHLGIKAAVPKSIMELMNMERLTRENVASHLQKYRIYLMRMQGLSNERGSPSDDHIFASNPVQSSPRARM